MHDNSFDDDVIATEATSAISEEGVVWLTTEKTQHENEYDGEDREEQEQEQEQEQEHEEEEEDDEENNSEEEGYETDNNSSEKINRTNSNETEFNPNGRKTATDNSVNIYLKTKACKRNTKLIKI